MQADKLTLVITTARFDESLVFYRDLLGMRVLEEWSDFGHGAVLEVGPGSVVELIDSPTARATPAEDRTVFMGLQVGDPESVHHRVVQGGGRVNGPPTAKPWGGRGFTAFDPDGMPVNIYTAYEES